MDIKVFQKLENMSFDLSIIGIKVMSSVYEIAQTIPFSVAKFPLLQIKQ